MRPRLHLPSAVAAAEFVLDAAQSAYLLKVLRLRAGAELEVFDGNGTAYEAVLHSGGGKNAAAVVHTAATALPRSAADMVGRAVHIGQGVCAAAKMDWAVEKMTELGAASITPLLSGGGRAAAVGERQLARWRRITAAACAQCGRNALPPLHAPVAAAAWAPPGRARGVLLTPRAKTGLAEVLADDSQPLAIAVGGESGFGEKEEEALCAAGFVAAHLGARILRSETAALAVLARVKL